MTDKMREEFEAWWSQDSQAELRSSCAKGWAEVIWKASRAALMIDLPEGFTHHGSADRTEYVLEAGSVVSAIQAAGVRVKP